MGQQREHVRVVLVGDAKTGKTSLITVAASDHWPEQVPPVLPLTILPTDLLPERMPVIVIDTSSRQEDWPTVEQELKKADAIIITYATDRQETFSRLRSHWLPEIRRLKLKAPICLVGCKQDLRTDRQPALEQVATELMNEFPEVETTLECSAKAGTQVGEVFYYAQKAVMHPLPPLYDSRTQRLTPRCTRALKRIFTLCDEDKDGILSDDELNNFQVMCFNAPLQEQELAGVKSVVYEKLPAGVQDNGLTLLGFYLLHTLFIDKGRLETTWTVLRKYGYDDTVQLSEEIVDYPPFRTKLPDQSVELTDKGLDFLRGIFLHFDNDGDGALSSTELEEAFSTAPENPWEEDVRFHRCTETNADGALTLRGFLVKWQLFTLLEPQSALAFLIYLGFPDRDIGSAFRVTRRRRLDRKKKKATRDVIQGFVFGSSGVGKSAIVDGLIDRSFSDAHTPTRHDRYAAQVVSTSEGADKTLVLREVTGSSVAQLLGSENGLAGCDVAAFVFDSTSAESLTEAVELLTKVADHAEKQGHEVPCTLIAAKRDSGDTVLAESVRYATDLGLEAPLPVSIKQGDTPYTELLSLALKPHSNIPETESSKLSKQQKLASHRAALVTVGLATVVVGGFVAYRIYARHKQQASA